jgi:hypothetical protein
MPPDASLRTLFAAFLSASLLAVGVWHLLAGPTTDRVFAQPANVRRLGAALLLLAIPCALLGGWCFWTLAGVMAAHGSFRLFAANLNIRMQKFAYPRWVHGWIMSAGGVAMWWVYVKYGR